MALIQIDACFVETLELIIIYTTAQIALRQPCSWNATVPSLDRKWLDVGRDHRPRDHGDLLVFSVLSH